MKKIEPTKNTTPIAGRDVELHCVTIAPTVKHDDPTTNRTAIHQSRCRGRHQDFCPGFTTARLGAPALSGNHPIG